MSTIDITILAAYFVLMIGIGFWYSRKSAQGMRSYFLGDNESKWWMLAASGSSSHYSVNGTVWMISMLMVLGMKSWWTTLIWWMPSAVFLMMYMGLWIRRTGVLTSAELNRARFGTDTGALAARVSFAVMIMLFSIAQLAMSYLVVHKFAGIFGFPPHRATMIVIGVTGFYVLIGGFRGVVLTDFLQTMLLFAISFVVGWICFRQYSGDQLHSALEHGTVTVDYWKSLAFDARPDLGVFSESTGYSGWGDFAGAAIAFSIVGMIGSIGGAGGRYGEQRFLAAKTAREAGLLAALWQFLAVPRWVLTASLAFVGFIVFRQQAVTSADPDAVMPLFLQSELMITGVKGLVIAGLVAAYMSTFSSEVNATASIIVRDIFQPLTGKHMDDEKGGMFASYLATGLLVVAAMGLGWLFTVQSSLNSVWMWMLGGLVTCYVVPLALRWYWAPMNGWGSAVGSVIGLIPALGMLSKQFVSEDAWIQNIPDSYFTYAILTLSFFTCIIVSLLTKPVATEHIDEFYRRVRPFGFWKSVSKRAMADGKPANEPIQVKWIAVNLVLGIIATYALYMAPVYFLGYWFKEMCVCLIIFVLCGLALYYTWYKKLPEN